MILTNFICYCGSVNIIKYLLINDYVFTRNDIEYTVRGGSEAIIELLQSNDYQFHGCFAIAIRYHKNNVARWLYENYHSHVDTLPYYIQFFNTEMFFFFFKSEEINQTNHLNETSLHYASRHNSITLVKFLILKGADKTIKDENGNTSYDVAPTNEMKVLLSIS